MLKKFKKAIVDKRLKTPRMLWKPSKSRCATEEEAVTRIAFYAVF